MKTEIREMMERFGTDKINTLSTQILLSTILDSNNIAKKLKDTMDIKKTINRSKEELKILGFTNDEANKLNILAELIKRLTGAKNEDELPHFTCPNAVAEFLIPRYRFAEQEHFIVCCFNAKNKMISYKACMIGSLTNCTVHPREIYLEAIKNHAAAIVVAHNHPSGDAMPSKYDNELTECLQKAGHSLGIPMLDHIIIGDGCYYSYREDEKIEDKE